MFTITKIAPNNFSHFDGFKEMNFSNWEINFNNTTNTIILQLRNGAPFPKKEVLASEVIIKDGISGTPETFSTTEQIRTRLLALNYNPLQSSGGGGGAVDSVNGQTGVVVLDADDVGAIPISGTTVGNPITGDLEFYSSGTGVNPSINVSDGIKIDDGEGSSVAISSGTILLYSLNENGNITISFPNNLTSRGISGSEDYTPNITDLDYTQKKYVDDLVATVTGIFFGSVEPIDTPTGTDAGYWIATEPGTYTNFGGVVVDVNSFAVISRDDAGSFSISQTPIDISNKADLVVGKNKFNKDTAVIGSYITDTNSVFPNPTYDYSDLIKVIPGVEYKSNFNIRFSCYYDVNQNVVAGGLSAESSTFTPPAGAVYTKITIFHTDIDLFQLEIGTVSTDFESYKNVIPLNQLDLTNYAEKALLDEKLSQKADLVIGRNKFNKDTAVIGSYISDTGSVFPNATYDYSDFIAVTPGVQYKSNFNIRFSCYFDVNQNVVAGGLSAESSTFTPPAGAVYTKITIFHTDIDLFQLEIGTVSTDFESYKNVIPLNQLDLTNYAEKALFDERLLGKVDLVIGTNKFDKDTAVIGSYLGENNVPIVNATYDYSDFIPVKELAEYVSNYPMRFTTYFDADKNLVTGGSGITTSGFTIPLGVEFVKITIWHTDIDLFQLEIGSFSTPYQNYKLVVNPENLQIYSSKIINDGFAEVLLPSEIYLTETLESNIYISNAVVPEFGENLDSFRVNIDSVKGAQFDRFWRYTPTIGEAGTSSLSLELKNKRTSLLTKSTSLNIASIAGGSGVNRKVLLIGDSTVDGEDINIPLKAFFDADVMDITTIGTRGSTGNKHEGRSGWTVNDYATAGRIYYRFNVTSLVGIPNLYDVYSNNGSQFTVVEIDLTAGNGHISCERTSGSNNPILTASTLTKVSGIGVTNINYDTASVQSGNPFWNSTTSLFDFQKYLTDTSQTMAANDWVFIQLGINDMFGQTTIESAEIKASTMMSQLTAIMNNIQSVVPNIRIGVMMTIPPAESQDSFASNYGNSYDRELYFKTGNLVWNRKLLTDLDTAVNKTAKRYVIAGNLNLDTVNNFPTATVAVNSRNATTEIIQVNSVHPSESGYAQITDSYISIIKYFL